MRWSTVLAAVLLAQALLFPASLFPPPLFADDTAAPKRVLLLGQKPDTHPATTHEYMAGMRLLARCLSRAQGIAAEVVQADDPWEEGPERIAEADTIVLFLTEGARWVTADARRLDAFARHAAAGKGLVVMHWGMGVKDAAPIEPFLKLFGGCHGGPDRRFQVVKDCPVLVDASHPVAAGISDFRVGEEEFYYRLKFVRAGDATGENASLEFPVKAIIDGVPEPVSWAWTRGDGGRSFGFSGGHFHANWRLPEYRRLMAQAVLWTSRLPVPAEGLDVTVPSQAFELE